MCAHKAWSPQRIWPELEFQGCWELNSSGGAVQALNCWGIPPAQGQHSRKSTNCFLRGKAALLYAISFIADLKPHHCSILRSAPEMKRCRGRANTPQFLNQGQLVLTWTSSTVYLPQSLHEDGNPRLHGGASDFTVVLSCIYLSYQILQFLLSITLIFQLQWAFSTTSCLYNGNMLSALLLELALR